METILLVILILVTISMIGAVLLQRSEGGALGIGGGGPGAMFSARGSANFLTRMTAGLAAVFMILSLVLAMLSRESDERGSVMDVTTQPVEQELDPLQLFDSEDYEPEPLEVLESEPVPPVAVPDAIGGEAESQSQPVAPDSAEPSSQSDAPAVSPPN